MVYTKPLYFRKGGTTYKIYGNTHKSPVPSKIPSLCVRQNGTTIYYWLNPSTVNNNNFKNTSLKVRYNDKDYYVLTDKIAIEITWTVRSLLSVYFRTPTKIQVTNYGSGFPINIVLTPYDQDPYTYTLAPGTLEYNISNAVAGFYTVKMTCNGITITNAISTTDSSTNTTHSIDIS